MTESQLRKIDVKIATRIMGWQWATFCNRVAVLMSPPQYHWEVTEKPWMGWHAGIGDGADKDIDGSHFYDSSRKQPNLFDAVPKYSTDEIFIPRILTALPETDWGMTRDPETKHWKVSAGYLSETAETLSLALCLVALEINKQFGSKGNVFDLHPWMKDYIK